MTLPITSISYNNVVSDNGRLNVYNNNNTYYITQPSQRTLYEDNNNMIMCGTPPRDSALIALVVFSQHAPIILLLLWRRLWIVMYIIYIYPLTSAIAYNVVKRRNLARTLGAGIFSWTWGVLQFFWIQMFAITNRFKWVS